MPNSKMNFFRYEFQKKNFGFTDCKPEQFYISQWGQNRLAFIIYRVVIFAYSLAWIIADLSTAYQPDYWIFLTNWSEVTGCLHFLFSLIVAIYGYKMRNSDQAQQKGLRWFHKVVWLLFTTAISVALLTDIVFWTLLSQPLSVGALRHPLNIHSHAINYLLLLIDLFVNDLPLRMLHVVYPMGYGLVYAIFSVIIWGSGYREYVYPIVNWGTAPGQAALVSVLMTFVGIPLLHLLWHFGLYKLRVLLAKQCVESESRKQQPIDDHVEMNTAQKEGQTNEAFNENVQ